MACSFVSWQHSLALAYVLQMCGIACGRIGLAFLVWVAVALFENYFGWHEVLLVDRVWVL